MTQPDRFRRPYADAGVMSGEHIRPYVTGTALTQWTPENMKYLDLTKADQETRRQLDIATLQAGQLLITDSGTVGRVIVVLAHQAGMIATNNAIRITIDDAVVRGYIYQFLRSSLGQALLASQSYGSVQQHVDRQAIADLRIPFPRDEAQWRTLGQQVVAAWQEQEHAFVLAQDAQCAIGDLLASFQC